MGGGEREKTQPLDFYGEPRATRTQDSHFKKEPDVRKDFSVFLTKLFQECGDFIKTIMVKRNWRIFPTK